MFESKTVLHSMVAAATQTLNQQAKGMYWKGFWKGTKVTLVLVIALFVVASVYGVQFDVKLP